MIGTENTLFVALGQIQTQGVSMVCELCHRSTSGLINLRVCTREGIQVCEQCYKVVDSNRHKPYSKIMDKQDVVETSYKVSRRLETLYRRSGQISAQRTLYTR
jgi:ribosome-binding protein aMBF1 (putative translation factor)